MIPKLLHQIWLGATIPPKLKQFTIGWKNNHPEFEHRLWTDSNVWDEFGGKHIVMARYNLYGVHVAQVSDVLRLLLLAKYGGVYVDTDVENFANIEPLLKRDLVCYSYGYNFTNVAIAFDFVAAVPNNKVIEQTLVEIDNNLHDPFLDKLWKYGFYRFQDVLMQNLDDSILLYSLANINSFLKHHFGNSWCGEQNA